MSTKDAARWNQRYSGDEHFRHYFEPRPFLVECACFLPKSGLALDAAMGLGGNAAFLLERGLRVIGLDISWVAVRRARERLPGLMAAVVDLNYLWLPKNRFDVILNFYYLQRDLWSQYRRALRPGGLLLIETLTREMLTIHPEIEPGYLLAPEELLAAFRDWQILVYREGWVGKETAHPKAVASLAARRPA